MSAPPLFASDWHDGMREVVAREWSLESARAVVSGDGAAQLAAAWRAFCAADFVGAAVPEAQGGSGLDLAAALEVAAAVGAGLAPTRLAFEALLPALVLRALPDGARADDLLAAIAQGERIAVATRVRADDGALALEFVHGVPGATRCLVVDERAGRIATTEASALNEVVALRVLDGREIGNASVTSDALEVLAAGDDAAHAVASARWAGALLAAADALGAAASALDQAIDYANQRRQFGVPIGSFQAIKHALVDRFLDLQVGRALLAAASEGGRVEPVASAMAKAHVDEAAVRCANTAIQTHGAVGFTDELGLHLYQRRVLVDRELFAGAGACLAVVRESLGLRHVADPHPIEAVTGATT